MAVLALNHLLEQPNLDLGPDMVEAGLPKAVAMRKAQVDPRWLAQASCRAGLGGLGL